jgi:O-antigen ligase
MPISLDSKLVILLLFLILAAIWIKPFTAFLLFLFFRPIVDPFRAIYIGGVSIVDVLGIFVLLIVCSLFVTKRDFKLFPPTPIRFIFLFFLFALFSLLNTQHIFNSLEGLLKIVTTISIYVIVFNFVQKKQDLIIMTRTIIWSSIIPILIGLYQIITGIGIYQGGFSKMRIYSVFVLSNVFAVYLTVILILIISLFFNKQIRRKENLFYFVIFIFGLFCLVKTYTVSAWLVLFAAISIICFYERRLLKIFLPICLILGFLFQVEFKERFQSIMHTPKYGYNSVEFRNDITSQLFSNAFLKHPFIGFGIGTSKSVAKKYTSYDLLPHNDFMRIMIETGILGLFAYLLFMLGIIMRFMKRVIKRQCQLCDIAFFSIFTIYFLLFFGSNTFSFVVTSGYMFCCFGMGDKIRQLNIVKQETV